MKKLHILYFVKNVIAKNFGISGEENNKTMRILFITFTFGTNYYSIKELRENLYISDD